MGKDEQAGNKQAARAPVKGMGKVLAPTLRSVVFERGASTGLLSMTLRSRDKFRDGAPDFSFPVAWTMGSQAARAWPRLDSQPPIDEQSGCGQGRSPCLDTWAGTCARAERKTASPRKAYFIFVGA
jgi:hypothetical protein